MTLSVCSDSTTVSFNSWPDDDEFEDEESEDDVSDSFCPDRVSIESFSGSIFAVSTYQYQVCLPTEFQKY